MCKFLRIVLAVGGNDGTDDGKEEHYHATTEILQLDNADANFAIATELELPMKLVNMAHFKTNNSLFLTGGWSPNPKGANLSIYKITCQIKGCKFVTLKNSLKYPKDAHVSLPIPDSLAHCTN